MIESHTHCKNAAVSYTHLNYIDECIQSVINQTLKEVQIICVDAGSTDGTYERLRCV